MRSSASCQSQAARRGEVPGRRRPRSSPSRHEVYTFDGNVARSAWFSPFGGTGPFRWTGRPPAAFNDRHFPSRLRDGKCPPGDQLRPGASQWSRKIQGPCFRRIAALGRERCGKGQSDHGCDEYHAPRECHLLRHFVLTSLLIEPLWSPSRSSSVALRENRRDTRGVE